MNYDLSQEQKIMKDAAHNFLLKECPSTFVRQMAEDEKGYTSGIWRKMAELGWMGLVFPERYGGAEGSFLDLAVLLYEMGYACLPGPFLTTIILGGLTVLEAGNETQKEKILSPIARGEKIVTLAWTEKNGNYSFKGITAKAEPQGDHYVLCGTKLFIPYAHVADTFIVVTRTGAVREDGEGGLSLFLIDRDTPGIRIHTLKTLAADKQCEVVFDRVKVSPENLLGRLNEAGPVLKKIMLQAAVGKCAEMSGGGQKVIELVLLQAKERVQFGKPIGAFQAVQHHCANMLTYLDSIKFMTYQGAWAISQNLPYEREASMCKAWVSDSYRRLVAIGHQVMGGMGFMEEHDLHLYFRQAKAAELIFGDADFHREWVAQQMGI